MTAAVLFLSMHAKLTGLVSLFLLFVTAVIIIIIITTTTTITTF